ncbi:MAG TPA: MOSC domain-containing protein, partial [Acidimicrobiales bacterium]|nr:MOSC domain-containing protein [Acidimicrobiales bacterium]
LINASKAGALLTVRPDYDPEEERLTLAFPGGRVVTGEAATRGRAIVTSFFGRPVAAHVVEGPWAAALSEHLGRSVVLARCDQPGSGYDDSSVSIVSTASLDELFAAAMEQRLDFRRFRTLVEVAGCRPREEDLWCGRHVRLGAVTVAVRAQIVRCVVTTLNPETGARDFETLRSIRQLRRADPFHTNCLGVYAEVVTPGWLRTGDPVEVLEPVP